jgi:ATP-dependent exoDNAse (exonuclease V) beta subunit
MITPLFSYQNLQREFHNGFRHYALPDGSRAASVTTILEATKTAEQKQALASWRQRVGEQQARQITTEAAGRGTRMHRYLEQWIRDDAVSEPGSNPYSQQSHQMATGIIERYLKPHVTEYYGSEVNLYYPGLYAGTTDCVASWQGKISILDFKQTNRPKLEKYIGDYFCQLAAYIMAHNEVYNTDISQGVILMCSQNCELQEWVLTGTKLETFKDQWISRVEQFYK